MAKLQLVKVRWYHSNTPLVIGLVLSRINTNRGKSRSKSEPPFLSAFISQLVCYWRKRLVKPPTLASPLALATGSETCFKTHQCSVLLPENLRAYFELSVQAWILYKAPQWNARYPNSCPERIKLKMHWGCGPRPLLRGWFREVGLRGQNLNMVLTIITIKTIHNIISRWIISKSLGSNL